ncbi:MAG: hypothetical protein R3E58_17080 [Phycisphaerae bacterium]|nr:hypothetical protein [Phycisphaerales bacterium]
MFTTGILADIWNVVDFGIEESLDQIQSLGAQSISLRVTSSRVSQLRAGELDAPRIFRSDGGYFFQPDKSKYSNTRIKPVVASWLKSRDPLEQIVEACQKRDIELRLRISTLESPVIAARHPEAASKTVFGDVASETLSAANRDVVELLRATVIDLSNRFAPAAIEVDGLTFHSGAMYEQEFDAGNGFHLLMELSFDESSAQSAISRGVDVEAVTRWVRVALQKVLDGGDPLETSLEEMAAEALPLKQYINSQIDDVTSLVEQMSGAANCPISLRMGAFLGYGCMPRVNLEALAHDRGVITEFFLACPDECECNPDFAGAMNLERSYTGREIPAIGIDRDTPQRLVSEVRRLAATGVGGVVIASYGLISPNMHDTIKQAFRYAARDSS